MSLTCFIKSIGRKVRTDNWNWEELGRSSWTRIKECIVSGDQKGALELVDYLLPEGKRVHDLYCDWTYGMLTYVSRKFGEEEVYSIQRANADLVVGGLLRVVASLSVPEFIALLAETMRSHRSGSGELGDFKIREENDRFVMSFDPCGSGGRMMRTGELDGTPPRTLPPYNLGFTSRPYPWSWGKAGVPYYCTHCCIMMEIIPIEVLGYPLRVHEFPDDPRQECKWLIYKDQSLIPEHYFTRIGKKRKGVR